MKIYLMKECLAFIFMLTMIFRTIIAQVDSGSKFEYIGNTRVNARTNIVAAMYNINSKVYKGDPNEIARQFLGEHKKDFGIIDMSDLKHLETIKSPAGNHIGFMQTYNGIPIYGSETVVSINKENRVTMVVNGNSPVEKPIAKTASVSKESALSKATSVLNADDESFIMKPKAELYIYRDSLDNCYLTWKISFIAQKPHGDWQVFIDANTGEELLAIDISDNYVNGTGRVFKPDPITALQNINLSDQNNTDYPALQNAYDTLTLSNLDNPINGIYRLWGQYVRSDSIEAPNTTLVRRSDSNFLYNRSQAGFEEVNAYYFLDMQRQYIGSLGFSPQWNGQDYIRFDAHGLQGANNSNYVPSGQYISFGDGDVDGAEDLSVILHEYGHALQDAFMVGTGSTAYPYHEARIGEGIGDYLAISYRRTLSSFQEGKVFSWDENITDLDYPGSGRWLQPNYNFEDNWNGDKYAAGTTWASTLMDIQTAGVSRDIITKLFFTACSYVSPTSFVHDHIYAMLQADIDLYGGTHLTTIINKFNNRGFFTNSQLSGTITSNTTWSGNILIMGDITVTNGATLTISPDTEVKFYNGSRLIMNNYATLNANGTSAAPIQFDFVSPNSSTQNGIVFNSSSMATINYCQIRNAYRGIYENNVTVNITNSAISGCTDGIYLYSSSPIIQDCNIHDNSNYGINMLYSSPTIKENYIQNNNAGIYCSTNSQPVIGNNSPQIGNHFSNNNYGVIIFNNALPKIGNVTYGGYNNFVNPNNNILNSTGNTVYAHNNWWGTTNPAYFKITGPVSYTPYRTSAVNIDIPPLSKTGGDVYASENSEIPMLSELDKAYELIASGSLSEARLVCLNLINNYPDYSVSFNALNLLKETYMDNELTSKKNVYKSIFDAKSKRDLYAMAGLILSDIDKENKLKQIDEVIENYKGESVIELALFDKFVYYYFELDDVKNARTISDELDKQFPESMGAIEAHKILGDEKYFKSDIIINKDKIQESNPEEEIPNSFSLDGNYPNPFNPTTEIKFSVPVTSNVKLTIYNIMGQEIKSFESDGVSVGTHSFNWNGTNVNNEQVASGIYIYRLRAIGNNGQVFEKSAKMMLLK